MSPAAPGRRERNKAEKLQRIREAARAVFTAKGYDDATTREIARRAGVGLGTLFSYASHKRDLLFLIFNSDVEQVYEQASQEARSGVQRAAPLLERLLAFFGHYWRFFLEQPALSRFMLRELNFYETGKQARRFHQGRENLIACLRDMAAEARASGQLGATEEPEVIAQALFSTYASELRRWIGTDSPALEPGLERLRRMLKLQMGGLQPRPGAR